MFTERELAIVLHAGAKAVETSATLVRGGIAPHSPHLVLGSALSAMRNKAIELERMRHPAVTPAVETADPAAVVVAGESDLYAEWRAMLDEAGQY